jgi:hypothetical protein
MSRKMTAMHIYVLAILCGMFCFFNAAAQSADGYTQGIVWHGDPAVTATMQQIIEKESWMKEKGLLKKMKNRRVENNEKALLKQTIMNPESPAIDKFGTNQPVQSIESDFDITLAFDGIRESEITQGWAPPDPMLAVGPKQVILVVNGRIRVFDKTSGVMQFDVDADVFFNDVRGGDNAVDPRVVYDPLSQRWFIVCITTRFQNNRITIAASNSAVLTPQTTVSFYYFQQNKVGPSPNIDDGLFADYETLGVDGAALYIGCNMFNSTLHTSVFVVNKANLLSGTLTVTPFRNIGSAATGGPWTAQGVSNSTIQNPTEGYFIGTDYNMQGRLVLRKILNPGGVPSISPNINITVPTTAVPKDAPNRNGFPLDAIDTRLLQASISKNINTGAVSLWTSHSILVNSSGIGTSAGDRNGVRWYEIGNLSSANPVLLQSGTLFDAVSVTNPKFYWMGTISMNKKGNAMISCTVSSKDTGANGVVAMHYNSGAGGTTSLPKYTTSTNKAYFGGRWGDYSTSTVDPIDNTTFWGTHEYMGNTDYTVRVVRVRVRNTVHTADEQPSENGSVFNYQIFPNPVTSIIHISLLNAFDIAVTQSITDYNGQLISHKTFAAGTMGWNENVASLKPGIYWITLTSEKGYVSKTIQFKKE